MSAPGNTILIVDDDSRNIFALSMVLRSRGYTVRSETSALSALRLLAEETGIAVVLLDMMMPELDGYEAIGEIREIPTLNNLPIVAVTARAMNGDREKCLDAGATDYLSKPVDIDLLDALLSKYGVKGKA